MKMRRNTIHGLAKKYGGSIPIKFVYGHAIAFLDKKTRKTKTIVAAESELRAILVDEVTRLEDNPGYFLSALIKVNIDGEWKNNNDLTEEEIIKSDMDSYYAISEMFKKVEKII